MTASRPSGIPPAISDEFLSAYIDGQVSASEKRRVEQALAADAQVRQRLQSLQATVQLFGQMPQLSSPRAFVLSEQQVLAAGGRVKGVEQPSLWSRLMPRLMPLATAAVALALVVVLGFDYMTAGTPAGGQAQPAASEPVIVERVVSREIMEVAEQAEEKALSAQPNRLEGLADRAEIEVETTQEVEMSMQAAEEPAAVPQAEAEVYAESAADEMLVGSADFDAEAVSEAVATAPPAEMAEEMAVAEAPMPAEAPTPAPQSNGLLLLEIALALLLVILVVATVLLRRRARA